MEIEYNVDTDEFFIVIPDRVMTLLGWDDGDFLEYNLEDEFVSIYKV